MTTINWYEFDENKKSDLTSLNFISNIIVDYNFYTDDTFSSPQGVASMITTFMSDQKMIGALTMRHFNLSIAHDENNRRIIEELNKEGISNL